MTDLAQLCKDVDVRSAPRFAIMGRPWTAKDDQQMIELHRSGLGFRRIGQVFGKSETACRKRYLRIVGSMD